MQVKHVEAKDMKFIGQHDRLNTHLAIASVDVTFIYKNSRCIFFYTGTSKLVQPIVTVGLTNSFEAYATDFSNSVSNRPSSKFGNSSADLEN